MNSLESIHSNLMKLSSKKAEIVNYVLEIIEKISKDKSWIPKFDFYEMYEPTFFEIYNRVQKPITESLMMEEITKIIQFRPIEPGPNINNQSKTAFQNQNKKEIIVAMNELIQDRKIHDDLRVN